MNLSINYWRPMYSAPKDRTPILTDCGVVTWRRTRWVPCSMSGEVTVVWHPNTPTPRVWMPVPEAPVGVPDPAAGEQSARIASAAPELFDALSDMVRYHTPGEWVDTSGPHYKELNTARAAITKAKTP